MHSDSDSIADEYTLLGKLFVLAEKSKEVILAALVARAKESALSNSTIYYPAIYTVQIIYEGTTEGSPACDLMVDLYTEHVSFSFITDKSDTLPKDFLRDLSVSLLTKRPVKKEVEALKNEKKSLKRKRDELEDRVKSLKRNRDELEDVAKKRHKRVKSLEKEVTALTARVAVERGITEAMGQSDHPLWMYQSAPSPGEYEPEPHGYYGPPDWASYIPR
jgi:FtsZ-binding cell division protein ZapB